MDTVPECGHSESLRDQIVRAICPGHYVGAYPNAWVERANVVLTLVQPSTLMDPLDPTYQRGFVAGANAVLDIVADVAGDEHEFVTDEARRRGFIG